MSEAPTQVAPGVHRLGNALVNCYLIEDGNRMTLVDGGLPGFRPQLVDYLRSRGASLADIDAVILTHAHSDHIGMAELVRDRRAGAPSTCTRPTSRWPARARSHARDGRMLPYLRHPAVYQLFFVAGPPRRRAHAQHHAS